MDRSVLFSQTGYETFKNGVLDFCKFFFDMLTDNNIKQKPSISPSYDGQLSQYFYIAIYCKQNFIENKLDIFKIMFSKTNFFCWIPSIILFMVQYIVLFNLAITIIILLMSQSCNTITIILFQALILTTCLTNLNEKQNLISI